MRNPNSVHTEWQRTLKMKSKSIDHEVPDLLFWYCNYAASANRFSEISRTCMDYGLNRFTLTFTKIDIPVSHLIYLICRTRVQTITPSLSNNSCMNYGRSPWKIRYWHCSERMTLHQLCRLSIQTIRFKIYFNLVYVAESLKLQNDLEEYAYT